MTTAGEVRWAPRVSRHAIRRLYRADASGIVDEELIDDVGFGLYARCRSIIKASAAHRGVVTCPRCESTVRREQPVTVRSQTLRCGCGWTTSWGVYHDTYRGRFLTGGSALKAFEEFERRFPLARTPRERLLAIDGLITSFHHELRNSTRPAGINLIEGSLTEVLEFLTSLSEESGAGGEERSRVSAALARSALGNRLRLLRRAARLTGAQLGARIGTSQGRISSIETGRALPGPEQTERMAVALGADRYEVNGLVAEAIRLAAIATGVRP